MERLAVFALILVMAGMFAASVVILKKAPRGRPCTPVIHSVKGFLYAFEKDPGPCIATWLNRQEVRDGN
jgi:hypothetical protein